MKNDNDQVKKDAETEAIRNADETDKKEDIRRQDRFEKKQEECELKYRRALADYQNLQKRVSEEKVAWIKLANRELLLRILPVLDTLILAGQHSKDPSLQVSLNQFLDILKSEGVVRIETIDKQFDPSLMEAIETIEGEEGRVLEELRAGFFLYEKLLRPAQVKVGKKIEK